MTTKNFDLINSQSRHNTTALLLGSGELGKEVAIELIRYGITVIACDRYDGAPAMAVAQKKAVINMRDGEALENLIRKVQPDYIIPEIEAIATETLIKLEKEGFNVVPSALAAYTTMNRETIRTLAAETLQIATSPYFFASSLEEIRANVANVGFPCIMKPVMSSSGKGQSLITCDGDIDAAFENACQNGRGGMTRVIVEGFIKFEREITLLTISAVDGIHFCLPIGHHQVNGDYHESWQPEPLSDDVLMECKRIASSVVQALGGYGIFGVELFICKDQVIFSELSPRPHDTGMVTMISQDLSEFALHVRALLGLPIGKITFIGPSASAAFLVEGDGNDLEYHGVAAALGTAEHSQIRIFGKPEVHGERRMGVCLARADNLQTARDESMQMRELLSCEVKHADHPA